MKSKISSLFLSVIIAVFAINTAFYASPTKAVPLLKKSDYKDVTHKKWSNTAIFKQPEILSPNTQKSSVSITNVSNNTKTINKSSIAIDGEFSYKNKNLKSSNQETSSLTFKKGMYYGLVLSIILLNFVCYFIFEEKLFLFYAITLTAITCVFLLNDGTFALNLNYFSNPIQLSLLTVAIGCNAIFVSKYLSLKKEFTKLKNFTIPLFSITVLFVLGSWFIDDTTILMISKILLFSILCLYFLVGISQFSKKNYAKFYVIASAIPLLFAIDFFVLQDFGFAFLFTKIIHLKIATLVEMLLLTFGILFRMQAIKEEIELRKTEMKIFIKQKNMMERDTIENLVEDIYLENLIIHYDLDGLEIKLLQYISEGKSNEKICRKLKLSNNELEDLTQEVYEKLEIREKITEDYRLVNQQPDYIYN